MTPRRKANYQSHSTRPVFLAYFSYPDGDHWNVQLEFSNLCRSTERLSRDETAFACRGRVARHGGHADQLARPEVRSTVLRCVGGASWAKNQRHAGGACRVRTLEHLFQKTSRGPAATNLERLFGPYGRTSRRSTWHNAPASRSVARSSSLTATASRMLASPPWCTSRCSTIESQAKEPKANARSAVATSGRPAWVRVGSSVVGSRTATSERMDATGGESAATNFIPKIREGRRHR